MPDPTPTPTPPPHPTSSTPAPAPATDPAPHLPHRSGPPVPEPGATHETAETHPPEPRAEWKRYVPNVLTLGRLVLAGVFVVLLSVWNREIWANGGALEFFEPVDRGWLMSGVHTEFEGGGYIESFPGPTDLGNPPEARAVWLVVAAVLFIVAALTDAADGYLARRWKVISRFGRVMDPFADKVLVLSAFILLAGPQFRSVDGVQVSGVLPWMAVVILARELLVTTIRGVYEAEGVDFSAGPAGKLKMVLQSGVVPAILLIVGLGGGAEGTFWRWVIAALAWATVLVTVWSGIPYVTKAVRAGREIEARKRAGLPEGRR